MKFFKRVANLLSRSRQPQHPMLEIEVSLDSDSLDDVLAELRDVDRSDYLAQAAQLGRKAKEAVAGGNHDAAWRLIHEMKVAYIKHANRSGFTPAQALRLDASCHVPLANILRLEGKHHEAMPHVVYEFANADAPFKNQEQRFRAYFNRCKLKNTTLEDARAAVRSLGEAVPYTKAETLVRKWIEAE